MEILTGSSDVEILLYLRLYLYSLVSYQRSLSWTFSTCSSRQPTVTTGCSGQYLLFWGWMIWNLLTCANQQIAQGHYQCRVMGVSLSELVSDWKELKFVHFSSFQSAVIWLRLLSQIPFHAVCKKYKITAEGSHERYQACVTRKISCGSLNVYGGVPTQCASSLR